MKGLNNVTIEQKIKFFNEISLNKNDITCIKIKMFFRGSFTWKALTKNVIIWFFFLAVQLISIFNRSVFGMHPYWLQASMDSLISNFCLYWKCIIFFTVNQYTVHWEVRTLHQGAIRGPHKIPLPLAGTGEVCPWSSVSCNRMCEVIRGMEGVLVYATLFLLPNTIFCFYRILKLLVSGLDGY